MENKRSIIGIDARFYGPLGKGLGRYTQEVVDNIINLDKDNRYVIFLYKENFDQFEIKDSRIKKVLVKARWYSVAEQLIMPYLILRERIDVMHFPHFNVPIFCPVKFIVTIHDLILTKFPTARASTLGPAMYRLKNLGYKITIRLAVRRAKRIIAVSEFTKKDIVDNFHVAPEMIEVTYEGIAPLDHAAEAGKDDDKKTLLGYNIHSPYLLYVGNAYPHKNLESLIDVFSKIKEKNKNLQLVLVGKEDYFYLRLKKQVRRLGHEGAIPSVIFAGYVPDSELASLYRNAICYVFASFYEGFGLPPLEAMAYGCPVVSSNRASMPEILSDAAVYFDPSRHLDMQRTIEAVVADVRLREDMARRGFERIKKYDWLSCAKKTLEIYNRIK